MKNNTNINELKVYCDSLEKQFDEANANGVFEMLKIMILDEEHSDADLVKAVNHFNDNGGSVKKTAPVGFLGQDEIKVINWDGQFRPKLYSMLLSVKFSQAIESKKVHLLHSNKFSFESK